LAHCSHLLYVGFYSNDHSFRFLIDRIENYQLNSLHENISNTIKNSNLLSFLTSFENLSDAKDEIQQALDDSWTSGFTQEISIVSDKLSIVASTNKSLQDKRAQEVFDSTLIVQALLNGEEKNSTALAGDIPVKNFCYPIDKNGKGLVYVRADLSSIQSFLRKAKLIFIEGTLIALGITVLLGFALARSITVPINDLTDKVQIMSLGDFKIQVPVKSSDEIGQLAEMFNLLAAKLDLTISEINNEKEKLGTILRYMADGLLAIDLFGKILHINPAAKQILRIDETCYPEGCFYQDLMSQLDEDLSLDNIKDSCEKGGGEHIFRRESETYIIRYDHFKDEKGSNVGIILLMQDITERQKLEDMQTEFVANVSHELKTPLTNIKSYTETLLDGAIEDHDTALRFLQVVDKEADRMNRLVKDLLQLSRLDHQKEPMYLRESNIVLLLNMALMKIEMTAAQKKLKLQTLYDIEADIRVLLDKDRMEQVFMNILSNAMKYTNEGGSISVDVNKKGEQVYISVMDSGIGIPKESLPRIFERFYRVDKARSRAMGGTGLGLAITREIVDSHGGHIEAESELGKGTKITIVLPLAIRRGVKDIA